jgi:hypothetical protein
VQAVGQKGDEHVGFDAPVQLVVDRPEGQVTFKVAERFFYLRQLGVKGPQLGRLALAEVGPQQVTAFPPAREPQPFFITPIAQKAFARAGGSATVMATNFQANPASARACPSLSNSSSRPKVMACKRPSRCQSCLSRRQRIARSLSSRERLRAKT